MYRIFRYPLYGTMCLFIFCSCAFLGSEIYSTFVKQDPQSTFPDQNKIQSQIDQNQMKSDDIDNPKERDQQEVHHRHSGTGSKFTEKPNLASTSKLNIVILSSMPRSGSTLIGELLSTYSTDIKYYFEPDQYIESTNCLNSTSCIVNFFSDLLSCNENLEFLSWYKKKRFFFKYYNEEASKCDTSDNYNACVNTINLISDCKLGTIQIIKNIRVRLSIFSELLKKNKHLKVIHLYRDPRGSLWSIDKFKWSVPEEKRCQGLLDDLLVYDDLEALYPNRITQVSYEFFSLDPLSATRSLFSFLFNTNTLPERTLKYISKHLDTNETIESVMSTTKNSKAYFQSWRWKISKQYLIKIEKIDECRESISKIGYHLFKNIKDTKNNNISLFDGLKLL